MSLIVVDHFLLGRRVRPYYQIPQFVDDAIQILKHRSCQIIARYRNSLETPRRKEIHEAQGVLSHNILRSVSTVCEIRMPPGPAVHGTKAEDGTIRWSHVDCTMRSLVEKTSKKTARDHKLYFFTITRVFGSKLATHPCVVSSFGPFRYCTCTVVCTLSTVLYTPTVQPVVYSEYFFMRPFESRIYMTGKDRCGSASFVDCIACFYSRLHPRSLLSPFSCLT